MKTASFFLPWILFSLCLPGYLPGQSSTTHTIQKGETLFSIAKQYEIDIQQLKKWNNDVAADQLSVGQSIIIGGHSGDIGNVSSGETAASGSRKTQTHSVEKGETLFSISKQYQVTIAELKAWNNLTSNSLKLGQALTMYPSEPAPDTRTNRSVTAENEIQQNRSYVVKNNDSLYKIAQKHGMTVSQLKKLNNLATNTIRVGQQLAVRSLSPSSPPSTISPAASSPQGKFISYEISEASTTVSELIQKFQMDEQEFRALNDGIRSDQLQNGQEVTVLTPSGRAFKNPYVKERNTMSSLGTISVTRYEPGRKGDPTTSGELYNPEALTGAHSNIALGSIIFVKNPDYPHGVFIQINDRISGNGLKLSSAAWNSLHFSKTGDLAQIYQDR